MPSPAHVHWAKFRIAIVALAALAVMATITYLLTGGSLLRQQATIYLYIPDATGLEKGAPVRVDGVDVGKVASVRLTGSQQPNRVVRVAIRVNRNRLASISADSTAQLSADTLIGDQFVDVSSGTSPRAIQPGGELAYQSQEAMLKNLDLSQFTQQLRKVDATLADIEQGRSQVGRFVQGDEFYNDLSRRLTDLQRAFHDATGATTTIGSLLSTDQLHRQISDYLVGLDETVAKVQSGQGAGRLLRDSAPYDQLLDRTRQLRHSIAGVRAGPFLQSDQSYHEWTGKLASWIQNVDKFNANPALGTSLVYDNLNGAAREFRDTLRDFRQNPRKYLRIKIF